MQYVHELMKTGLMTHTPEDTLRDAEKTMGEHHIRHLPVVDPDGKLVGLMSQREFLAEAFRITDKFGANQACAACKSWPLRSAKSCTWSAAIGPTLKYTAWGWAK